jgi:hypothetical protein
MQKRFRVLGFAALAAIGSFVLLFPAEAQRRERVCFYQHDDFSGAAFCAPVGTEVGHVGGMNDQFSSMRAPPGVEVTACEHSHFRGACIRLSGWVPRFSRAWNDRISSFSSEFAR